MSYQRPTALAGFATLTILGFGGHLTYSSAQSANNSGAKVYADSTSVAAPSSIAPVQAGREMSPQKAPVSAPITGCDLRCRTGFFGYN